MKKLLCLLLLLTLTGCQGDGHKHVYKEADYKNPATCTVCGQTTGERLLAYFESHGIEPAMKKLNQEYDYRTGLYDEDGIFHACKGTLTVLSDEVSDQNPFATALSTDGTYEIRTVEMKMVMADANSNDYGFDYHYLLTSYNDPDGLAASFHYSEEKGANTFSVLHDGRLWNDCRMLVTVTNDEWQQAEPFWQKTVTLRWQLAIPQGYDGLLVGLRSAEIKEGQALDYTDTPNFVLYRVGGNA